MPDLNGSNWPFTTVGREGVNDCLVRDRVISDADLLPQARTAGLRTVSLGHQPQSEWPDWDRSMQGNVRKARLAALRAFRRIGRFGLED